MHGKLVWQNIHQECLWGGAGYYVDFPISAEYTPTLFEFLHNEHGLLLYSEKPPPFFFLTPLIILQLNKQQQKEIR